MPKGIRTVSITPDNLRAASLRGDLWMTRYFFLEKVLSNMGLDYSHARKMAKDVAYDAIFAEESFSPLSLPTTKDNTKNPFYEMCKTAGQG